MEVKEIKKLLSHYKEVNQKIVLNTKGYIYYEKVGDLKEKGFYIVNNDGYKLFIAYDNVVSIK